MAFSFRSSFPKISAYLSLRNFRMSTADRAQEALEELKTKNPYFEKYAAKLAAAQQSSPEEFLQKLEERTKKTVRKEAPENEKHYAELVKPKENLDKKSSSEPPRARLDDILKTELIQDKTAAEITALWLEYYKLKDCIAAGIPVEQYDAMMERAKEHPLFLFPLPREQGYEFVMLQFSIPNNSIHFTPLLCYQVHKENAPECLSLVHYTELRDKGLILMRGEYDSKVINIQEAQCLANQLQLYYSKPTESKLKLLETFTKNPGLFKHTELVREIETLKI